MLVFYQTILPYLAERLRIVGFRNGQSSVVAAVLSGFYAKQMPIVFSPSPVSNCDALWSCFLLVLEETEFDVSGLIQVEKYLEVVIGQQRMRLYIIPGVDEDTVFAPQTKKEISEIAWHMVDELLVVSNETQSHNRGSTGMKNFMVWPFIRSIKNWIHKQRSITALQKEWSTIDF